MNNGKACAMLIGCLLTSARPRSIFDQTRYENHATVSEEFTMNVHLHCNTGESGSLSS